VATTNLIDAVTVEFEASKRWLSFVLYLNLLLYFIALIGIFGSGWFTKGAAIAALVTQGVAFLCRVFMGKSYSLGEKVRRLAMLKDGLGIEPSAQDVTTIATRLGFPDSSGRSFVGEYYASAAPRGQKRLLEILDECSYWTAQGARVTRNYLALGLAVAFSVVSLAFVISVQAGVSNDKVVKVFISTVGFVAVGELASLLLKFDSLSKTANHVLADCAFLANAPELNAQPLIEAGEYNCALASAGTPVPTWIYKQNQAHWNAAYDERRRVLFGDGNTRGTSA
jgi:hypothetical protein